ncbi:hypothetical protein GCM10017687_04660 [Streptomyces echinatus]
MVYPVLVGGGIRSSPSTSAGWTSNSSRPAPSAQASSTSATAWRTSRLVCQPRAERVDQEALSEIISTHADMDVRVSRHAEFVAGPEIVSWPHAWRTGRAVSLRERGAMVMWIRTYDEARDLWQHFEGDEAGSVSPASGPARR